MLGCRSKFYFILINRYNDSPYLVAAKADKLDLELKIVVIGLYCVVNVNFLLKMYG